MKILIAGSHGMIGSAVTRHLLEKGHEVVRLVRHTPGIGETRWNPDAGEIDLTGLEGFDGVVNLAAMRWPMRWTNTVKQKGSLVIGGVSHRDHRESEFKCLFSKVSVRSVAKKPHLIPKNQQKLNANRAGTNHLLAEALAQCEHKPSVLICASGIGYYLPSGDTIITEDSPVGNSFLTSLNRDGETATNPASEVGIRVVHLRIPMVLGGERLKMLGFQAGSGQQWMSWIGLDEVAFIVEFALITASLSGPVNCVSPNPMRLTDFARTSTEALGQKPGGVMPAFIARLFLGEMGEEFLLASRRAQPAKLLAAGYQFHHPDLADALQHEQAVLLDSSPS